MKIELYDKGAKRRPWYEKDIVPFIRITKGYIWIISSKVCQDLKLETNSFLNFTVIEGVPYLVIPNTPDTQRDLLLNMGSTHGRKDHSKKFCCTHLKRWLFSKLGIPMPDKALFTVDTASFITAENCKLYRMTLKEENEVKV
ncbi:MAG TPA: hypothetical protein VGB63_13180 [Pedobacter sp.]|jgi:hypothetical protein